MFKNKWMLVCVFFALCGESSRSTSGADPVFFLGQEGGNGGEENHLEWDGLAELTKGFVRKNADLLKLDSMQYDEIIRKTVFFKSYSEDGLGSPVRRLDSGHFQINGSIWRKLTPIQKRSYVLNFYLERLREDSVKSEFFTGGRGAALYSLDWIAIQQNLYRSLLDGEFPNVGLSQTQLTRLYGVLRDTWVVAVEECILTDLEQPEKKSKKTALNFQKNNLILFDRSQFQIAASDSAAVVRVPTTVFHEYLGMMGIVREKEIYSARLSEAMNSMPVFPAMDRPRAERVPQLSPGQNWFCENIEPRFSFAVHLAQPKNGHAWRIQIAGGEFVYEGKRLVKVASQDQEVLVQDLSSENPTRGIYRYQGIAALAQSKFIITIDRETSSQTYFGNAVLHFTAPEWNLVGPVLMKCELRS